MLLLIFMSFILLTNSQECNEVCNREVICNMTINTQEYNRNTARFKHRYYFNNEFLNNNEVIKLRLDNNLCSLFCEDYRKILFSSRNNKNHNIINTECKLYIPTIENCTLISNYTESILTNNSCYYTNTQYTSIPQTTITYNITTPKTTTTQSTTTQPTTTQTTYTTPPISDQVIEEGLKISTVLILICSAIFLFITGIIILFIKLRRNKQYHEENRDIYETIKLNPIYDSDEDIPQPE